MLFVKVATGIGCGIITNGEVHRGADGAAGDIGHVRVAVDTDILVLLRKPELPRGCRFRISPGPPTGCRRAGGPPPYDVVRLSQAGDARALRLVRVAGQRIGEVLASLVNFYNPNRIILGGALAGLQDNLLAGIRAVVYERALPLATRHLSIETTRLGHRSAVLGATILGAHGALVPGERLRLGEERDDFAAKLAAP